jgi:4-amino-4-deoxy-L-arabinose transferase-like glycosyltransferase
MSAPFSDYPNPPVEKRGFFLLGLLTKAGLVAGLIGLCLGLPHAGTPGWDATGHAFAALRMAEALRGFDLSLFWAEFSKPDFYAPLGRLGLASGFLFLGDAFSAPRTVNCFVWILVITLTARLARRIAPTAGPEGPASARVAAFWAVFFGLTCTIGVTHARSSFLEPLSALATVLCCLVYLRARDSGRRSHGLAAGLLLGAGLLIKYTYGLLVVGAVGLTGLWGIWKKSDATARRIIPSVATGLLAVLFWWFVLPLPSGFGLGTAHREIFIAYLTKATGLAGPGPYIPWVAWALMGCLSLVAFALQAGGVLWGLRRWNVSAAARLCAILALVGPLAIMAYPFRIDRFILPTLPAAWALGGAFIAALALRIDPKWRGRAQAGLVAAILFFAWGGGLISGSDGSGGPDAPAIGDTAALRLLLPGEWSPEREAAVSSAAATWADPYAHRPVPATGPEGTALVLDFAARHFDANQPFAWIGGTGTELPLALIQWRLFQESGNRDVIFREPAEIDHLMLDEELDDFDEAAFQSWANGFDQIGVLNPPDPKGRARPFEVRFAAWMQTHPGFRVRATEAITIADSPFTVTVYAK